MAGLGQEAVVPLRPELLNIRPLDFSVQENAVARMTDAFRKGQIEANDVIERYSVLNKTKEKVAIQNLDEFISPQAIATRQNQQAALNTEAILKSSPEYIAAREAEMQATINSAQAGSYPDMLKFAISKGFFPKNRDTTWTQAKSEEAEQLFADANEFSSIVSRAQQDVTDWKADKTPFKKSEVINKDGQLVQKDTTEVPTGEDVNIFDQYNQPVSKQALDRARQAARMTPAEFLALKKSGAPIYGPFRNIDEGETSQVIPKAAGTPQQGPQSYDEEVESRTTKPDGTVIEVTKKRSGHRIISEDKETPIQDPTKKPSEGQAKAILATPGIVSAETNMDTLKTMGWDNTTWGSAGWSILAAALPGVVEKPLETAGRKIFENAIGSFKEGMLRLLSGGAITEPEQAQYREMYFPMPRDPIQLVQSKEKLRAEVGEMVSKLATQGLATPIKGSIEEKNIQAIHARALQAQSGVVTSTSTQADAGVETPISTGTLIHKPGGGFTVRAGTPTNAPMVTPKLPSTYMTPPVVTPR